MAALWRPGAGARPVAPSPRRGGRPQAPPIVRFHARLRHDRGHWIWAGTHNGKGNPQFKVDGCTTSARRWIFTQHRRPLEPGERVEVTCDEQLCVLPAHLDAVRVPAAARREAAKTACKHGHPYTPANTYRDGKGYRACRLCRNARARAYKAATKAAAKARRRAAA